MKHNAGSFLVLAIVLVVCYGFCGTANADVSPVSPTLVGDCSLGMFANCDSSPDQGQLELAGNSGAQRGNWDDLSGGVTNRPYVTSLSVINSGVETVLISSGTTATSLSNTPGSVGVVIAPVNLCDSTQTPAPNVCYSTPNRIQVTLAYRKASGEIGYNFSFPNDGDLGTTTGNAVTLKTTDGSTAVVIDENTTIDMTLALNTLGTSLRWSWLNGDPSYWGLSNLGQNDATVRLKFKLASLPAIKWDAVPSSGACTAIPVSDCEISQSHSDWLAGSMILSLDETLSVGMTGALFATNGAIIGSVDAINNGPSALPTLRYGLSSSHLDYTGATRSATLRAFLPDAGLVQVLGIPSFSDPATAPASPTDVLSIERVGSNSTVSSSFDVWNTATNGSNGLLMTVTGVTFSAPQYNLKSSAGAAKVSSPKLSGGKYKFTMSANSGTAAKICKKQKCTAFVYRASTDVYSPTLTKVASKVVTQTKKGYSAAFEIKKSGVVKKDTRLLAIVKNKSRKVLSSVPLVLTK